MYLHTSYISLIYTAVIGESRLTWSWVFSKELIAIPTALHAKFSARQEPNKTTQENTAPQRRQQLNTNLKSASLDKLCPAAPIQAK